MIRLIYNFVKLFDLAHSQASLPPSITGWRAQTWRRPCTLPSRSRQQQILLCHRLLTLRRRPMTLMSIIWTYVATTSMLWKMKEAPCRVSTPLLPSTMSEQSMGLLQILPQSLLACISPQFPLPLPTITPTTCLPFLQTLSHRVQPE